MDDAPMSLSNLASSTAKAGSARAPLLVRKTLGSSKCVEMHRAAAAWEDIVYKLNRPLRTQRRKVRDDPTRRWLPTTPGMAAGLTDHLWTVKELLTMLPTPLVSNT